MGKSEHSREDCGIDSENENARERTRERARERESKRDRVCVREKERLKKEGRTHRKE